MSPSPAGDDWSAVQPVDLSVTNQPTNLPPHFRPSGFCVDTRTDPFFIPCIVSRWFPKWFQARVWAYVSIYVLIFDFVCVIVCAFVCVLGWALVCQADCSRQLGTSDWAPMTRGNQILSLSLSSLHTYTHLFPLVPLIHKQQKHIPTQAHTSIHTAHCTCTFIPWITRTIHKYVCHILLNILSDNSHQCCTNVNYCGCVALCYIFGD